MIYFSKSLATGSNIKIGFSKDPDGRVKGLGLPGAEVLAATPGDRKMEARLHRQFAHLRIDPRSEYFLPGADLLAYISGQAEPTPPLEAIAAVGQWIDDILVRAGVML